MIVYSAHDGRSYDLPVDASTRVEAVQHALATLTDIAAAEQILIVNGTPLDARQPLSAYRLPHAPGGGDDPATDVFLYSKAHLRASGVPLQPEALPPLEVPEAPAPDAALHAPHALDAAASPLVRALPQYERGFRDHLAEADALASAGRQRLASAVRLANEMEVQARAIEAARSNVETHYAYICAQVEEFQRRYAAQRGTHSEVLARFERDMAALAAAELPRAAQSAGLRRVSDLLPEAQLREWAAQCQAAHGALNEKVGEVEAVFLALKADVEALFMTAPSVSLAELAQGVADAHRHLDSQENILQLLQADCGQVERLVGDAVAQLSAALAASAVTPLDRCQLMEQMNDNHAAQLLPRARAADAALAALAQRCLECKNRMTRDVLAHLRAISAQQSKIRGLRNKLAILREAAARHVDALGEFRAVRATAAAYSQCLAECMRRAAFAEIYSGQAAAVAERLARLRDKETARRAAFRARVERAVPPALLAGLGLTGEPPWCQVSLPAPQQGLLHVAPEDLRRLPLAREAQGALPGASPRERAGAPNQAAPLGSPAQLGAAREGAHEGVGEGGAAPDSPDGEGLGEDLGEGGPHAGATPAQSLQLENARLRMELAEQVAVKCAADLEASNRAADPGAEPAAGDRGRGPVGAAPAAGAGAGAAAAARFRSALAARVELSARLDMELSAARAQAAAYEARIRQLEEHLTRTAVQASSAAAQAPLPPTGAALARASSGGSTQTARPAPALGEDSAAEGEDSPGACTWVSRVERRSEELRRLFKLPPTELVCDQFQCALQKRGLLLQGQLFIFERYVGFHSRLFGVSTVKVIPLQATLSVRKQTNLGFSNSLEVTWRAGNGARKTAFLTSFLSRNEALRLIMNNWQQCRRAGSASQPHDPAADFHRYHAGLDARRLSLGASECSSCGPVVMGGACERNALSASSYAHATRQHQALRSASLSANGGESPAPGDSDAASVGPSDVDTDGGGGGGGVWQPLAECVPPLPGREWVPIEAGDLALDPRGFFRLVLGDESNFFQRFHKARGDMSISLSRWRRLPGVGLLRELQFVTPIKSRLGPPRAHCHQAQRYRVFAGGDHLVFESTQTMTEIPFGEYFSVETRWDVVAAPPAPDGTPQSRVSSHVAIPFTKQTLYRAMIVRSTLDGCREAHAALLVAAAGALAGAAAGSGGRARGDSGTPCGDARGEARTPRTHRRQRSRHSALSPGRDASSARSAGTPRALWRDGSLGVQRVQAPPAGSFPSVLQWLLLLGLAAIIVLQVAILLRTPPPPTAAGSDIIAAMERRLDALQQALAQHSTGACVAAPASKP
ncbi:hypothetical protein WJX81_003004 [Elliptochloris bilobata]|uniref:VASt domain-containing protein n=1 Tax=Elliptochloris bilobata TaxID=381761 RepID=A0AAW1SIU0_9CHLO